MINDFSAGYSRYYQCRFLCECCLAQKPTPKADKRFTCFNFSWDAPWVQTVLSWAQIMALQPNVIMPLGLLEGFNAEMYHRDTAHTNSIGQWKDSIASSLVSMLDLGLLGTDASHDVLLARVHDSLDVWADQNGLPRVNAPRLSLRLLGRGDSGQCYPELSSKWKAVNVDILAFFVAHLTEQKCKHNGYEQLIATHCWAMAEFMHITKQAGVELSPLEVRRTLHAGRSYLVTLQALCSIAKQHKLWLWRCRPKNHYFDHILLTLKTSPFNPEVFSCLRKESMLGKLKKIGRSCSSETVPRVALHKWTIHQSIRFRIRKRSGKWKVDPLSRKVPLGGCSNGIAKDKFKDRYG
jgi:hypothetical protein